MADDHKREIRLEAAISKYFCTEVSYKIVDETLQIRGGQGYENSSSLAKRGADFWPVERVLRDSRINRIIEGTSEIMHLFIAREALDPHLSKIKPLLNARTSAPAKLVALGKMIAFYALWYPKQWLPSLPGGGMSALPGPLASHMAYVQRASKKLARGTFHKMMQFQQKLESKQSILNRIVDIGTELFAISATCSYAAMLKKKGQDNAVDLADNFCWDARKRIDALFLETGNNSDKSQLKMAKKILAKDFEWLENQIIK